MIRILKALLVLSIGLHALFYVLQNIANLEAAHGVIGYVFSMADHQAYPDTLFFRIASPEIHWVAVVIVFALEFSIGFFGIKGGWDLFRTRTAPAVEFAAAKKAGVIAAGLALLTWFGVFMTWGGAFFQMWQTEVGHGSMADAFSFAAISAIVILYVCLTPDD
jgi:predicted small integral membrane protein